MACVLCVNPIPALTQSEGASGLVSVYPGEYVVTLRKRESPERGEIAAMAFSDDISNYGEVLQRINSHTVLVASPAARLSEAHPTAIASLSATLSAEDAFCKDLLARKIASSCSPNYQLRISDLPVNDPLSSSLWGLSSDRGVDVARAWSRTTGSSDVVVAVIDTGIDYTHPDLMENIWTNPGEIAGNGIDDDANGYIDDVHGVNTSLSAFNRANPFDDNGHGTHVAGTIGAIGNNNEGVVGINQHIRVMALKFMDATGAGRLSDAISAINYMVDMKLTHGVSIVASNNSWGGGAYSIALESAITRAKEAGIIFVAAAGNSTIDVDLYPSYPSSYEVSNVVSVTAVDQNGNLAWFANRGTEGVDIAAPGVDILSTAPGGRYVVYSGTSMATPHVVGLLGLLFAAEPTITMDEAIARLYESGRSSPTLFDAQSGRPLIRTGRIANAGRLLANETERLPVLDDGSPPCGYTFQVANVASGDGIDRSADTSPIVNQEDEGGFYRLSLPFKFPFFRTSTDTLYLSPNGVVYLREPLAVDYEVAARAPNNSIAAFQSDLTPRAANQGVRVYSQADRVTISWRSEHYGLFGAGPIAVRLTIFSTGVIKSSISFEYARDPISVSRAVLGNPFSSPESPPLGLVGASAHSSRFSSTLNLLDAQKQLVEKSDVALNLSVVMAPTCFEASTIKTEESPRVSNIRVKVSRDKRIMRLALSGAGSGKIPLSVAVQNKGCSEYAWADLVDGRARLTGRIPRGVSKIKIKSGSAQGVVSLNKITTRSSSTQVSQMCSRLVRALSRD